MCNAARYFFFGLTGACIGYLLWTTAANIEDFEFYAIRRWVSNKSVMSEIVLHPADKWIGIGLAGILILGGATIGMLIAWRYCNRSRGG